MASTYAAPQSCKRCFPLMLSF